jgi:CubicO group peptidase (beta-lactamase class C family)
MRLKPFLSFCLLTLLHVAPNAGQAAEFNSFETLGQEFTRRGFSGTVLIKKKGEILFHEAFGIADLARSRPNSLETRFGVGSSTKQVTAAAILLLRERGLLSLETTLDKVLPEFDFPWAAKVTIHHLLTHTSGIFNFTETPNFFAIVDKLGPEARVEDMVALFQNKPLKFEPGTQWSYSNSGFILAGLIVSKLSGRSYADFIKEEFFEKLEMTQTAYEPGSFSPNDANPIGFDRDYAPTEMKRFPMIWADAAGGIMSTAADWSRWLDWLHNGGRILSNESLALMKKAHVSIPDSSDSYGYGLFIGKEFGRDMIGHGGDVPGFHFMDMSFVNEGVQVIVATNIEPGVIRSLMAASLAGLALEGQGTLRDFKDNVSVPEESLLARVGDYVWSETAADGSTDSLEARVFLENGKLYIQLKGQMELRLIPQSENHFELKNIARIEFLENGEMLLKQGREFRFSKVSEIRPEAL